MIETLIYASPLGAVLFAGACFWINDNVIPPLKSMADRMAKGNLNPLGETYLAYLVHMREKPDEWLFNSDRARFPKEGNASKIFIVIDKGKVSVTASGVNDNKETNINGYYAAAFKKIIEEKHKESSYASAIRTLFPDKEHLLLGDFSKKGK